MKITFTLLFILINVFCTYGQKKATTNSKAKKSPQVNSKTKKAPVKTDASATLTADELLKACPKLIETTTDKMTGKTSTRSKNSWSVLNGNSGFNIGWVKQEDIILLIIGLIDNGRKTCVPDSAEVIILFTDGTRITRTAFNKFNCDGEIIIPLDAEVDKADDTSKKLIETIRVSTSKGYVQADFTRSQAIKFFAEINCLIFN